VRKGDNLYSTSTVAIDVKTGQIKWHYQNTPNDGWDFDGVNEFITFDMDGQRVGAKADRNGFFYINDAASGKLLNAFPFVKKVTWATGIDLKTGRPNFDPANRPGDPTAAGGDGTKGKSVFAAPGFLGGKNQMPMAYSPKTGLFYVPTNEWGMEIWNEPITYKKGAAYLGAGFTIKPLFDDHIGSLRAINPKTGKIEWEVKNEAPLWGGVLTAGDLVFWGTPEGFLKAADAKTGKVVWQFQTGSGVVAPPITWTEGGSQYISVVSGWGGAVPLWGGEVAKKVNFLEQGGSVWVFKLDLAGGHGQHLLGGALVGHMDPLDATTREQLVEHQVGCRAHAVGGHGEPARVGKAPGEHIVQRLQPTAGRHQHAERDAADLDDGGRVADRVPEQLLDQRGPQDRLRDLCNRVAVRRGLLQHRHDQCAPAAGPVLDDDALPQVPAGKLGQQAQGQVGGATGRPGHPQRDRVLRIARWWQRLRSRRAGAGQRGQQAACQVTKQVASGGGVCHWCRSLRWPGLHGPAGFGQRRGHHAAPAPRRARAPTLRCGS
jgi:outer membrane protein assembly factor BamB